MQQEKPPSSSQPPTMPDATAAAGTTAAGGSGRSSIDAVAAAAEGHATVATTDLVASLPAPVLRLLVLFAVPISGLLTALEVLFWKPERRVQSWMLVLSWWFVCFGSSYVFTWLVPPLLFAPFLPLDRLRIGGTTARVRVHPTPSQPATAESLLQALGDLNRIQAALPPSPIPTITNWYARFSQLGPWRLARGLIVIWAVWIALSLTIGARTLAALAGTAVLLLPSPPLAQVVHLLRKSLAARRAVALVFLLVFGSPDRDYKLGSPLGWVKSKWARSRRPSTAMAFRPVDSDDEDTAPADRAGNPIYFLFEIHENQRWWMGLDWTSALLPQERPSWCDSHLFPVSPPQAFTLPSPSSIDVPAPTKAEPRAMVRRTATWRWLDDDWSIVRAGRGGKIIRSSSMASALDDPSPHPRPLSGVLDDGIPRSPSTGKSISRFAVAQSSPAKAADARRGSEASSDLSLHDDIVNSPYGPSIVASDEQTDGDGWVYGDNKWEGMTSKGGLGKFTRRRRWHRRAVCVESVHRIAELAPKAVEGEQETASGAATPVAERTQSASVPNPPLKAAALAAASAGDGHVASGINGTKSKTPPSVAPAPVPNTVIPSANSERDDALRQRLKKAMGNVGG